MLRDSLRTQPPTSEDFDALYKKYELTNKVVSEIMEVDLATVSRWRRGASKLKVYGWNYLKEKAHAYYFYKHFKH